ncbi:hypothetical protein VYU27_000102 [Nannochloropsis oceanica]
MQLLAVPLSAMVATIACFSLADSLEYTITSQRVEYMPCPAMGIDVANPRFAWVVEPSDISVRGAYQEAFRIIITAADAGREVIWDSGRVNNSESRHIRFGSVGELPTAALASATAYDWTVTAWVATDVLPVSPSISSSTTTRKKAETTGAVQSQPSPAARFVTGMLNASKDWAGADWLVAANSSTQNLCRAPFIVPNSEKVERALLVMAGLGYFQASLNGARVSDAELESGWTDYGRRVPYSVYDVTGLIKGGERGGGGNVLGISLGNGWYSTNGGAEPTDVPRTFIAKLFVNGKEVLSTSSKQQEMWLCAVGPIVYDSVYNGEVFDGRLAARLVGWDDPAFFKTGISGAAGSDGFAATWVPAVVSSNPPTGELISPKMPPIRRMEELVAISLTEPQQGVFVVDFGQNIAGRVALSLPRRGKGSVTLRHAEVLQHAGIAAVPEPGMISVDNLRGARATDVYIFDEDERENGRKEAARRREGEVEEEERVVFEPTFTYHGFRYVEIRGYEPRLSDVKAIVLHTDVVPIGDITFSDALLNQIQKAIHWGQRANIMSVPTDCPQRDERKGWLGDAQLSGEEALFNFDMVATYLKFVRDITDTQDAAGQIGDTAPFSIGGRPADPSWGSAFPSLVYFLYEETGDVGILEEFYPALAKYVDSVLLAAEVAGVVNLYKSYGDWCPVPGQPMCSPHLTGSFSFLENLQQLSDMAFAMGKEEDGKVYGAYHRSFTRAFHAAFYHGGTYDNGVQTCLALPLWAGAVPADLQKGVEEKLVSDLVDTQKYHSTTGIIGMKYMLEVLSRLGKTDVAVQMLQQRDYPSFGYMLTNPLEPATTIWELWNSDQAGPAMNSRNHVMFGGPVGGWFYKYLGGVRKGPATREGAGYRLVIFAPPLAACMPLEKVTTTVRTLQGVVAMEWEQGAGTLPTTAATAAAAVATSSLSLASRNLSNSSSRHLQASIQVPLGSKSRVILDGRALGDVNPMLSVTVDGVDLKQAMKMSGQGLEVLQASDDFVELLLASGGWAIGVRFDVREDEALKCIAPSEVKMVSTAMGVGVGERGMADFAVVTEGVIASA